MLAQKKRSAQSRTSSTLPTDPRGLAARARGELLLERGHAPPRLRDAVLDLGEPRGLRDLEREGWKVNGALRRDPRGFREVLFVILVGTQ